MAAEGRNAVCGDLEWDSSVVAGMANTNRNCRQWRIPRGGVIDKRRRSWRREMFIHIRPTSTSRS